MNWICARIGHSWQVQATLNRKMHYVGLFTDEEEAARAYDVKARELFGEYAHLNFSKEAL